MGAPFTAGVPATAAERRRLTDAGHDRQCIRPARREDVPKASQTACGTPCRACYYRLSAGKYGCPSHGGIRRMRPPQPAHAQTSVCPGSHGIRRLHTTSPARCPVRRHGTRPPAEVSQYRHIPTVPPFLQQDVCPCVCSVFGFRTCTILVSLRIAHRNAGARRVATLPGRGLRNPYQGDP